MPKQASAPKAAGRFLNAHRPRTYRNGSTLAPRTNINSIETSGVAATKGIAAASASAGCTPRRAISRTRSAATVALITTSGARSIASVGPPSQKNGAAIHACTASM